MMTKEEILNTTFVWHGSQRRKATNDDVTINRVFWDKEKHEYGFSFVFRNEAPEKIGDTF